MANSSHKHIENARCRVLLLGRTPQSMTEWAYRITSCLTKRVGNRAPGRWRRPVVGRTVACNVVRNVVCRVWCRVVGRGWKLFHQFGVRIAEYCGHLCTDAIFEFR